MDLSSAQGAALFADRPRADRAVGRLVGTCCTVCEATSWPGRTVCHRCGSAGLREVRFEPTGTLLTHTTVAVARPGLNVPYSLGQIRLHDGPVVFGHVRGLADDPKVPVQVRLALDPDPATTPWYWFVPEDDQ